MVNLEVLLMPKRAVHMTAYVKEFMSMNAMEVLTTSISVKLEISTQVLRLVAFMIKKVNRDLYVTFLFVLKLTISE